MRILAVAAIVLSSSIAAAQAPGETMSWEPEAQPAMAPLPAPLSHTQTINYRRDILIADGLSIGMMTLGTALTQDGRAASFGLSGYLLAAPIVHLAHGRGGSAAKSLALRSLLPLAGAYVGYKLGPHDTACVGSPSTVEEDPGYHDHAHGCSDGSLGGLFVGLLGGAIGAMYIDAFHLAKYEKPVVPTWSANVKRTHGGFAVGIGRAF